MADIKILPVLSVCLVVFVFLQGAFLTGSILVLSRVGFLSADIWDYFAQEYNVMQQQQQIPLLETQQPQRGQELYLFRATVNFLRKSGSFWKRLAPSKSSKLR
jgi:hypothetical protein